MKGRLTARQNEAYEFIRAYQRRHHKPPTLQEIGEALGISSTNGVFKLLQALEKKGYLRRDPGAARGLHLLDTEDPFALTEAAPFLPVISRTASHEPERLRQRPLRFLSVDPFFLPRELDPEACLIGRAGDDGMSGDGIFKGDLLLIEETSWRQLANRELVACLIGELLLARRFVFANNRIHLQPANRTYLEEIFPPDDPGCYVIGRIHAIFRRLS
jgi:repressor LexA